MLGFLASLFDRLHLLPEETNLFHFQQRRDLSQLRNVTGRCIPSPYPDAHKWQGMFI